MYLGQKDEHNRSEITMEIRELRLIMSTTAREDMYLITESQSFYFQEEWRCQANTRFRSEFRYLLDVPQVYISMEMTAQRLISNIR